MGFSTTTAPQKSTGRRLADTLRGAPVIYIVLVLVLTAIALRQPTFFRPKTFLAFLQRAAPLIIVSIGQMYVMLSGEFDLSVGSLMTVCAAIAAKFINNDPGNLAEALVAVFAIAVIVGLINGVITTRLYVPSFVTTLGMLLVLQGAISIYTRGAPQGGITENFRFFGRGNVGGIPVALIVMLVVIAIGVILMHYTTFGRRIYAVGGNRIAAGLSGVSVSQVKTLAFILCSLFAAVAAILLAGFAGMSGLTLGRGFEFQSISAVVLGGVALTGGRGNIAGVIAGAFTLQALFSLLNFFGFPLPIRVTVQGIIIIGAVALAAWRETRRTQVSM